MKKVLLRSLVIILLGVLCLTGCTTENPSYLVIQGTPEVLVVDSGGDPILIDEATGAITTIELEHHEAHEGNAFFLNVNDDDLDNGDTLDLTLVSPDTAEWVHILWSAEGTASIHIFVYEGTTSNVTGSSVVPINRDRNSSRTSTTTCRDGDTFSDTGTLLWQWHTGDKKLAGQAGERAELILRQNTQYLFRILSENNDNKVSGMASWYELTNN